jgi:hypothetical protein
MTKKRRALVRLRDARGRLRDIEAARTNQAAAHQNVQEQGLATASRDLVSAVVRACERLGRARHVGDLEAAHADVGLAREDVAEAHVSVLAATEARRRAAEILRQRSRELRTTERVLDRVSSAERLDSDRREQRFVDDLVSSRHATRGDR